MARVKIEQQRNCYSGAMYAPCLQDGNRSTGTSPGPTDGLTIYARRATSNSRSSSLSSR